ncbi:MAG: helix-turn-helix transcriptional regulator [bacterium]|nr:helix-turn-helix transcriptional regulator [bacterium]
MHTEKEIFDELRKLIDLRLKERCLKKVELAKLISCDSKHLSLMLSGKRNISIRILANICKELEINPFDTATLFKSSKASRFMNRIAPFINKLSESELVTFAEMMKLTADKENIPEL